ncbi:MAG: hypothetical protein JSW67_09870 [Candidatus Latescibacterota bacterium]|nr:MAG: hypothetical protein JSW67_09870 [Candidatus Latescibacterota bacterium]
MTLHELPPALPPDEVEKLRWETFGHRRTRAIASRDELVRFCARRGFVLRDPSPGVHFPSVLEAAVGRPLLGHAWDERADDLEAWRRASVTSRQLVCAAVLGGHPTLIAPGFLAEFQVLSGNRGDTRDHERLRETGVLNPEASAVCSWLLSEARPMTASELVERLGMRGALGKKRLDAALQEAVRHFLIVESSFAADSGEPLYDLLPRVLTAAMRKAETISLQVARQRVVCRYLRNVIVAGCHEVARLLGWSQEETLKTMRRLEARHMIVEHPASRHNRWFFQAAATDLLG